MNDVQQDNVLKNRAVFLSFCIEQYAKAKNRKAEEIASLFGQYGISDHLCEFYEILHTYGHQWLIEEIDEMIKKRQV